MKLKPDPPIEIPSPERHPEIIPPIYPQQPFIPEQDPVVIPEEEPIVPPPYEIPFSLKRHKNFIS